MNYTNTEHVFYSGLYDIFRHEKPVAYLYRSQADADKSEPLVYISNRWTADTSSTVYVMSNCDEVELFVNGKSKGKMKPNKYTNLPHPIYEFTGISYEAGELKAVGYIDGAQAEECVRKTPGEAVKLMAKADYSTLTADGTDMTSVSVLAVDAEGNQVPFAKNQIQVAQTDGVEATLISERNAELEAGRIAFLVQSVRDSVGTAQFTVTSDGLEPAVVEIDIDAFSADNLVPVPATSSAGQLQPAFTSSSYSINDNRRGTGLYEIDYQGNGWIYGKENSAYQNDNHYSNTAGDTCRIRFKGTRLKYFGAKASNHGIAAFSLDGGSETMVDCYAASRNATELLFDTGDLEYGEHILTVRVTGEKNNSSGDYYLNTDRVEMAIRTVQGVPLQTIVNDRETGTGENQFDYSGTWATGSGGAGFYQGDNYWSNTKDASLTFRFTGTSVKYYTSKERNLGYAAFSIDDGEETVVDLYSESSLYQQCVYEADGLAYGTHTLKVLVTGEKNAASSDCCVVADKIEVFTEAEACRHENTAVWNQTEPSCKDGYTGDTYCLDCGEKCSEGEAILATDDHQATDIRGKIEATCTATGYTGDVYCAVCGTKIADGNEIPMTALIWNNGVVTKQPTATAKGEKTVTCTACGITKKEEIPALGETKPVTPENPSGDANNKPDNKPGTSDQTDTPSELPKAGDVLKSPSLKGVVYQVASVKTVNGKTTGKVIYQKPGTASVSTVTIPAEITVDKITYQVTAVAAKAFRNQKKLIRATIGKNVAVIGNSAFSGCTSLKSVKMGSAVKSMGSSVFSGCKKLSSVTIGKNVTSIGTKAFYQCTGLKKITIPSKVSKIGKQAFDGCKNLKTITIKTKKLTSKTVGSNAFRKIHGKAVIKVPAKKKKAYTAFLKKRGIGKKVKITK